MNAKNKGDISFYTTKDIEQAKAIGYKQGIKEGYAHSAIIVLEIVWIIILLVLFYQ